MRGWLNLSIGLAALVLALGVAEAVKKALDLAVPEPVLGVMVLLAFFTLLRRVPEAIRRASQILLPHMALFFIPALVGLMALSDILAAIIWPLVAIIIVSTLLPLWVTAWAFQKFAPAAQQDETDAHE